ncbi:MAG: FtsL-like putative cell division protein [Muribaculaceae bacterium]|nr:FtsL-like putative cell division protein [Muribaculaceae bacterium]
MASSSKKKGFVYWIKSLFLGRLISFTFFKNNWPIVAGSIALCIVFIASKYNCQMQLEEIMRLSRDLNNAQTERVRESSIYNSRIREPEMRTLIDSMKLGLTMPQEPPYKL